MPQPTAAALAASPPQGPSAFSPPPHGPVWRAGKTLVVLQGTGFPPRCVKCNGPALVPLKDRKVHWHHPALYLLVPVGLLIYAIVALIVRKEASVNPGLCAEHRTRRRLWIAAGWLGPILGGYVMAAGWSGAPGAWIGALLGLAAVVLGIMRSQIVVPARIDDGYVRLNGCGEPFLADLPAFPEYGRR